MNFFSIDSAKKNLEIQHVLWVSISHVFLAWSNYLLVLVNDSTSFPWLFFIKPVKKETSLTTQSKPCDMIIKEIRLLFCHKLWKHMHVNKRKLERNSSLEPYHKTNIGKNKKTVSCFGEYFKEWCTS